MDDQEFSSDDHPPLESPAQWWDELVQGSQRPEVVSSAFQKLVASGCREVELMERLLALQEISSTMVWSKRAVESYAQAAAELHDRMVAFVSTQSAALLRHETPLDILSQHVADVRWLLKNWPKTKPVLLRRRDLVDYVDRYTGGGLHAELALLMFEVCHPITIGALKVETSRKRAKSDPRGIRKQSSKWVRRRRRKEDGKRSD